MHRDEESDLARKLEEHARRIFNAPTEAEKKKAERELAEHIARPKQTDDIEQLAREFEIRLKRAARLPPGATPEQREAFAPLLERVAAIPPFDKWHIVGFDLWTQHLVKFSFDFGVEPLAALLSLKALGLICPPPEVFTAATAGADGIELARKRRAFVEAVEADVVRVVLKARKYFAEALSARLGSVLDETLHEIALRAIDELEPELNIVGKDDVRRARQVVLDEWTKIEKVRLGTPAPGAPTLTKEVFEAMIDDAQEKLRPAKMDQNKTAVVLYIKENYPAVRCGSVVQLNRLLKKHGLEGKFPKEPS